jgi:hypothetical protein
MSGRIKKPTTTPYYHGSFETPGAIARFLNQGRDVNMRDRYGATPIFIAAANGDIPMVKKLLSFGADPNLRSNMRAILFWPIFNHEPKLVEILIDAGAQVDDMDLGGTNALHVALKYREEALEQRIADADRVIEIIREKVPAEKLMEWWCERPNEGGRSL